MEIKEMVVKARKAQEIYEHHFDQDQVDRVIREAARVIYDHAEELARLAVNETGIGVYEHKVAKNRNKSKGVYYNLRGKKSMGIIDMDEKTGLIEIAKPIGVVAGITPMTNPIVTPMSKIIFALKTKNAIIIAPHPQSKRCSALAVNLIKDVVAPFGVPADLIQVIDEPSIDKTKELMEACDVVVATGGMPMVKSAYSSGKPSFGVGAGAFSGEKKDNGGGGMAGKMTPCAVLVIQNGTTKLVNVKNQDGLTKILDMVPDFVDRFTSGKGDEESVGESEK